jgi:protein-disulfide isomerase
MKKINIISLVAIVCVVLLALVFGLYLYGSKEVQKTADQPIVKDEAQLNKELNKDVVNEANKMMVKKVRPTDATDHYKGKLEAPVHLIVYSDFECPFCSKFADTVKEVEKAFGTKIVIAFRHYPLMSHTDAIPAAIASECAGEQGKFWEMHDLLFANAKNNELNLTKYKENAKELGLDQTKFNQCLDTEKYKDKVIAAQLEAKEFGVNGTPASFINNEPLPGAVPFEDFTDSSGESRKGMKSIIGKYLQ